MAAGLLGARLTSSPVATVWVFRILVLVIAAEPVHLVLHYVFDTA